VRLKKGFFSEVFFIINFNLTWDEFYFTLGCAIWEFIANTLMWEIEDLLKRDEKRVFLDIFDERKSAFDTTKYVVRMHGEWRTEARGWGGWDLEHSMYVKYIYCLRRIALWDAVDTGTKEEVPRQRSATFELHIRPEQTRRESHLVYQRSTGML